MQQTKHGFASVEPVSLNSVKSDFALLIFYFYFYLNIQVSNMLHFSVLKDIS